MSQKAIVLASGGLDSTFNTLFLNLEKNYNELMLLFFDYGQKAMSQEFVKVRNLAEFLSALNPNNKIYFKRVPIPFFVEFNSTLVNINQTITSYQTFNDLNRDDTPSEWIPNRNAIFINIGVAFAENYKYDEVVMGINKEEAGRYPDNTQEFLQKAQELVNISSLYPVKLKAYAISLTKNEIFSKVVSYIDILYNKVLKITGDNDSHYSKVFKLLNLNNHNSSSNFSKNDFISIFFRNFVWSCYHSYEKMCGECESCMRLKRAMVENNIPDEVLQEVFIK